MKSLHGASQKIQERERERERESKNAPILSELTKAYSEWHSLLQVMPRVSRYTLGSKIDELFVGVIELILFASYAKRNEKLLAITKASVKLDAIKFFLQLSWSIKSIDNKRYISLSQSMNNIGKMLGGWMKSLQT